LREQLLDHLRANLTINGIGEDSIQELVRRAQFWNCKAGSVIIRQGDPGHNFFLILTGQLRVIDVSRESPMLLSRLHENEFFGERALLTNEVRAASVDVEVDAELAVFDQNTWYWLTTQHPDIVGNFDSLENFYEQRARTGFPGRQINEMVIRKDKRHILALVARLSGPLFLLILALATSIILLEFGFSVVTIGLVAGIMVIVSLLWTGYGYIDWHNDDFIVTSERVIHIERTIIYGESREEAPLTAIQDVSVNIPNFFTRFFGYYDVIIKTAGAGDIVFDGLREGEDIKSDIFNYQKRAQERKDASDTSAIRKSLTGRMNWEVGPLEVSELIHVGTPPKAQRFHMPRLIDVLIPKVREESGDTIKWRKHYLILLQKISLPLTAVFVALYLSLALFLNLPPFAFVPINLTLVAIFTIGWIGILFWYIYQYDAWNKDLYMVTNTSIIDLKGSPLGLGPETRREGTFDVIQNTTYETPTFLTRILNMGNVVIESAGTENTFTFEQVYDYRLVQQEISKRLLDFKEDKRKKERSVEEKRFTRWLGEYHDLQKETGEIEYPKHVTKPQS
ncbi:MAG: cyclic nucleotide-binding domain-containing protein, partial [Chloroflexota bacterium]